MSPPVASSTMVETRVVLVTRDPARLAALAHALRTHPHVEVHVARTRPAATTAARAAPARVIVVADLHLDVPNAGLELVHHLTRVCPRAELYLLAPRGRLAQGITVAHRLDEDEAPATLVDTLLGTRVPTADMDAAPPAREKNGATPRAPRGARGRRPSQT